MTVPHVMKDLLGETRRRVSRRTTLSAQEEHIVCVLEKRATKDILKVVRVYSPASQFRAHRRAD